MKKLFYFAALFATFVSCTDDNNAEYNGAPTSAINAVSSFVGNFEGGKMGVVVNTPLTSRNYLGTEIYMECNEEKQVSVPATAANLSWKYFDVICNEATGFSHGENGWAVKNKAAGFLDNNRHTYSYDYTDSDALNGVVGRDQGLLAIGSNCDLSEMSCDGTRAVVNVGDEWFDKSFAKAKSFVEAAMETTPQTAYYKMRNGDVDNLEYPYTYYEYEGYKVILAEYDMYNGSCVVTDEEGNTWVNENAKAPWFEGHECTWPTDGNTKTMDHNVILVLTKENTVYNGRNFNAHIFSPDKNIEILGSGAPSGLVIVNNLKLESETHGENTTFNFVPTPEAECDLKLELSLDIDGEYLVKADDFAIQNGDKLYEPVAITKHTAVPDGGSLEGINALTNAFLVVNGEKGQNIGIKVEDICALYPSYVGKTNSEGVSYINESGELTLVTYIWPGTIENGEFKSAMDLGEGYLIGSEEGAVEYAPGNKDYSVKVSAYKGYQGVAEGEEPSASEKGWSYIKVSIHIQPRD